MPDTVELPSAPFIWSDPPLGQAEAAPAAFYTDEAVFRAEIEHIHLKNWFFVGRVEDVAAPGDFKAVETVGGPVLLARSADGVLRAFANVCRHRASLLLEGCGNAKTITCPYHAWSYRLDGSLLAAPGMREVPGFDKDAHALVEIRLELWEGAIFLNYDDRAVDLKTHLGDFTTLLASHRFGEMVKTWEIEIETQCNWKALLENAMESYHTGIVHAETVGAQTSLSLGASGDWEAIQVLSERSIAVLDEEPPFPPIAGLSPQSSRGTFFTLIQPTTQFACAQDCIWWLAVRPLSTGRSVLSVGGCFPKAYTELPDFEKRAAPYYARWEAVAREDVGILEKQHRAFMSCRAKPGTLSWREDRVLALNNWVLSRLPGEVRGKLGR